MKFLLQTLFDAGGFFKCDEDETPPLLCFVVSGKLSGFNLEGRYAVRDSPYSKNELNHTGITIIKKSSE